MVWLQLQLRANLPLVLREGGCQCWRGRGAAALHSDETSEPTSALPSAPAEPSVESWRLACRPKRREWELGHLTVIYSEIIQQNEPWINHLHRHGHREAFILPKPFCGWPTFKETVFFFCICSYVTQNIITQRSSLCSAPVGKTSRRTNQLVT